MQLSCSYASMVSNLCPTIKKLDVASRNVNAICREEIQRFFRANPRPSGFYTTFTFAALKCKRARSSYIDKEQKKPLKGHSMSFQLWFTFKALNRDVVRGTPRVGPQAPQQIICFLCISPFLNVRKNSRIFQAKTQQVKAFYAVFLLQLRQN